MTLMREETAYLVTSGKSQRFMFIQQIQRLIRGIAHLVPLSTTPRLPSEEQIKAHTAARIARVKAAAEAAAKAAESNAAQKQAAFERGGEKARLKREARAKAKAEKAAAMGQSMFGGDREGTAAPSTTTAPAADPAPPPSTVAKKEDHGYFQIIPPLPSFPDLVHGKPIASLPHPLFPFPSTARDRALLATFRDLSTKGYRMGLGPRFGGEYLIYPGDYLRYHAHFTSQVIVNDEPIKPMEIVGWGRLGTATKKAGLICCLDEKEDPDKVEFYSLEWANFG